MKTPVIAFVLLFAAQTFAYQDLNHVKVRSRQCDTHSGLEGSGLLFKYADGWYVLTSESVVYHTNASTYCHSIQEEDSQEKSVEVVAADWAKGLALLKIEDRTSRGQRSELAKLVAPSFAPGVDATFFGYATGQSKPTSKSTSIIATQSTRHTIAKLKHTLELSGGAAESGFVGGPVFAAGGRLAGIISNQYFKMKPGSSSSVLEWQHKPGEQNDHLVAIRADQDLMNWVFAALNKTLIIDIYRLPKDQLALKPVVYGGGLRFEARCPDSTKPNAGSWPIGGGDGVGIGGANSKSACHVFTTIAAETPAKGDLKPKSAWLRQTKAALLSLNGKAQIGFVFTKSEGAKSYSTFSSLSEFFKMWLVEDATASTVISDDTGDFPGSEPEIRYLRTLAHKTSVFARQLFGKQLVGDVKAALLLRSIYYSTELLASEQWREVTIEEMKSLLTGHQTAWQLLSFVNDGKELKRLVEETTLQLEKVLQP